MVADMRYTSAVGALALLSENDVVDLQKDDIEFLMGNNIWLQSQRNRARRCIEAFAYGALDIIGLPRFPLPAEFISAVIVASVHSSNWMTACVVMSGAEWTENVILRREDPLDAEVLFSHCLRISSGARKEVDQVERKVRQQVGKIEETEE